MTNPMLAELDAVVRLRDEAEYENVYGSCESFAEADSAYKDGAATYIATHHAEIADMAKRLEAAERDARRWRHARKLLTVDDIEGAQGSYDSFGGIVSEDECKRADAAIDAAQEGEG